MRAHALIPIVVAALTGCAARAPAPPRADPALEGVWSGQALTGDPPAPLVLRFEGTRASRMEFVGEGEAQVAIGIWGTYRAENGRLVLSLTETGAHLGGADDPGLRAAVRSDLTNLRALLAGRPEYPYRIEGDVLTLTEPNGSALRLTRVKNPGPSPTFEPVE